MKNIFTICLLCIIHLNVYGQINTFGEQEEQDIVEYSFAIKLKPSLNGSLIQVAIIKNDFESGSYYTENSEILFLSIKSWARQFAGFEESKANPKGENLIKKYRIFDIPVEISENESVESETFFIQKTESILNDLWRLTYSEYPRYNQKMNEEKGWAMHSDPNITWLPSESQMRMLRIYGIEDLSQFIIGDNVIQLLKDVRNTEWQRRYIQSAGVYNEEPLYDTIPEY